MANPEESTCKLCNSFIIVEKLCENCNASACEDCLINSVWIYSHPSGKGLYYVCNICASTVSLLENFIQEEEIKWSSLTPRGQRWFKTCGAKDWSSKLDPISAYYEAHLGEDDNEMIEKDVDTGRSDPSTHNWEVREILLRTIGDSYKEDIKKVLRAYCIRNHKVGYCQGMNVVTVWLLMFLDHNTAFFMLCYLIEKWLLPDFYIGSKHGNSLNGFYIESTVIASLLEHLVPSIKTISIPSEEFSDFFSLQHLIQMFVSTVDIQTTVFLWDRLCIEGSIALIRGIVSLIIISEKALKNGTHPLNILKLLPDNRLAPQVKEAYMGLIEEINPNRVERLRTLARDYRAKQWLKCEKLTLKKLENVSHFTKEEIEQLQEDFNKLLKNRKAILGPKASLDRRLTVELPVNIQEKMGDYQGSNAIGISKAEFKELLDNLNPGLASRNSGLFEKFDEDGSGYLDFRELTIAISMLSKGTFEEKVRILFDSFDADQSGYLKINEIQQLIQKILRSYTEAILQNPESQDLKETINSINNKLIQLCTDFNGKIGFEDFVTGLKSDIFLYNCISQYIGIEMPELSKIADVINTRMSIEDDRIANKICKGCLMF